MVILSAPFLALAAVILSLSKPAGSAPKFLLAETEDDQKKANEAENNYPENAAEDDPKKLKAETEDEDKDEDEDDHGPNESHKAEIDTNADLLSKVNRLNKAFNQVKKAGIDKDVTGQGNDYHLEALLSVFTAVGPLLGALGGLGGVLGGLGGLGKLGNGQKGGEENKTDQ